MSPSECPFPIWKLYRASDNVDTLALYPKNFAATYSSLMINIDATEIADLTEELLGSQSYYFMGTLLNEAATQTDKFELDIEFYVTRETE